jgi:hypothetical protein
VSVSAATPIVTTAIKPAQLLAPMWRGRPEHFGPPMHHTGQHSLSHEDDRDDAQCSRHPH